MRSTRSGVGGITGRPSLQPFEHKNSNTASGSSSHSTIAPGAFAIPPEQLASATKPTDPKITPFHWAIRRQFSAFYFDSDTMYGDDGDKATMADIAPGISETQGFTHNTVFIDMGPYLIAMEAPNDDGESIISLALASFMSAPSSSMVVPLSFRS